MSGRSIRPNRGSGDVLQGTERPAQSAAGRMAWVISLAPGSSAREQWCSGSQSWSGRRRESDWPGARMMLDAARCQQGGRVITFGIRLMRPLDLLGGDAGGDQPVITGVKIAGRNRTKPGDHLPGRAIDPWRPARRPPSGPRRRSRSGPSGEISPGRLLSIRCPRADRT